MNGPHSKGVTATQVAQAILDTTVAALMSGKPESFVPLFVLSPEPETFEGRRLITTEADVRAVFVAVADHLRNLGVTDFVRTCLHADFKGPDRIEAMHGRVWSRAGSRCRPPIRF